MLIILQEYKDGRSLQVLSESEDPSDFKIEQILYATILYRLHIIALRKLYHYMT
jgi:hypothetical protein